MDNISIAVVDDHQLFREGFALLLKRIDNVKIVHQYVNGKELINSNYTIFDIIFMDIDMPLMDGIQTTNYIINKNKNSKIIALSMYEGSNEVQQMFNAGCKGYLLKSSSFPEIELAISRVKNGNMYTAQDLLIKLNSSSQIIRIGIIDDFTEREKEIIDKISSGKTSAEIAKELNISKRTVDKHRENIIVKAGVNSSAELVHYCLKNKII